MADYNSVPLGQAGTGSAFVLGKSQAADRVLDTIDYNQRIAQQQEQLKLQQAQQLANSWKQNQLKVDGGLYWQPEFNKRYQGHLEKGIQLRQMGIDPFNYNANDPNQTKIAQDYLLERQGILADTDTRKALEPAIAEQFKAYRANPDDYESDSFQEINDYINNPFSNANANVPQLRKKFDATSEIVSKLDPVTFQKSEVIGNTKVDENRVLEEPTKANIESLFKSANGGERFLKRETGLTSSEAKNTPNTLEENIADLRTQYQGNPKFREDLAKQGIVDGQAVDDYLIREATAKTQAKQKYNNVIDQYYGLAKAKANEFIKKNPDYTLENQELKRRADARAAEANKRARVNFAERGKEDQDESVLYRKTLIDDMLNGVAGSGEKLKGQVSATSKYNGDLIINMDDKTPDVIGFEVPAQVSTKVVNGEVKTEVIPGRKVFFNKNDAGVKSKMNQFINEVTEEKIPESKFQTGNASGKVNSGSSTTTSRSISFSKAEENGINAVMKQSGATRDQVIEALKQAGKIK